MYCYCRRDFLEPRYGHCPNTRGTSVPPRVIENDYNINYCVDLLANYHLQIRQVDKRMKTSANMNKPEILSASSSAFTIWRTFLLTSQSIHKLRRVVGVDPDKIPLLVMFDVSCKDVYESKKVVLIENPKSPPDLGDDLVEVLQSEGDPNRGLCIVAKFIIGTFYIVDVPKCELLHIMNIGELPRS